MAASASCVRGTGTRGRRTRLRRGHGSEENRVRRCWLEKPCERRTDRSGPCRWLGSVMRMRALKADVIPQRSVDTASEGTLDFRRSFCRLHIDMARARTHTHTGCVAVLPSRLPSRLQASCRGRQTRPASQHNPCHHHPHTSLFRTGWTVFACVHACVPSHVPPASVDSLQLGCSADDLL